MRFLARCALVVVLAVGPCGGLHAMSAAAKSAKAAKAAKRAKADRAVDPGAPNWNGIWTRYGPLAWDPMVPNGQVDHPPLTREYQARYQRGLDSMAAGHPANASKRAPSGDPIDRARRSAGS